MNTTIKHFEALNVSSKFAICGLPIRVDTYKTCSFGCKYCFSNCRKIMEFEKELAVANLPSAERRLKRIFEQNNIANCNSKLRSKIFISGLINKEVNND